MSSALPSRSKARQPHFAIIPTDSRRSAKHAGSFESRARHPSHKLFWFKRAQEPASQVGQKPEFAITANQFPFPLGGAKVRLNTRNELAGVDGLMM